MLSAMARRPRTESLKNIAANMKAAPRVASGVAGDGSHVSHEKNPPTFHYTGWLIGILIMVYYILL